MTTDLRKTILFLLLLSVYSVHAQTESLLQPARVIFYNTENLFDTIDDPATDDSEFLPEGKSKWNTERYTLKLRHVARVLNSLLDTIQPLAIGLAEVENAKVLEDLIAQPELKKYNLGIVHHDSPDERGIDVALLYNKDVLEEVFNAFLTVDLGADKTRDILYFKAFMTEEYPIWFFVNHWSSRRTGTDTSEQKRMIAANTLKNKIENVYLGEPFSRIVVMGDLNDNPDNKSPQVISSSAYKYPAQQTMVNMAKPLYQAGQYSLKFRAEKNLFDQFIVSKNLLDKNNQYYIRGGSQLIYSPQWLLFNHSKYGLIPNRTFANGKYEGGYSDHLPVYFDVVFK